MTRDLTYRLVEIAYLLIVLVAVAIVASIVANSTPVFPPISAIAAELNISAGQTLPKGVVWQGRPYYFYIVSARQLPNGRYAVVLAAR